MPSAPTDRATELVTEALRRRFPDVEKLQSGGYCAKCPCHGENGHLYLVLFDDAGATQGCTSGKCTRDDVAGAISGTPPAAKMLSGRILELTRDGLRAAPPARIYMLKDANTGLGVYVQGKVGILAAPGGSGKSWVFVQLAVAQATGATWFGPLGWTPVSPGRVLLALAEEDEDEVRRRLHFAARLMGLNDEQYDLVVKNVDAVALTGFSVSLTQEDHGGELPETSFALAVRERLIEAVQQSHPYTLIILDPLSRFAGLDVEVDNAAATRWVQVVETFTHDECGRPSVLIAHHVKKKGEGDDPTSADPIRGSSALVAGVRWAARLEQQTREEDAADLLTLRIVKANGVPPQTAPLILCRDQKNEGALRVATKDEVSSHQVVADMVRTKLQKLEDHRDRVLAAMQPRRYYSRNQLADVCGKKTLVLEAIRQLLADGKLLEPLRHKLCLASDPPPLLQVVPAVPGTGTTTPKTAESRSLWSVSDPLNVQPQDPDAAGHIASDPVGLDSSLWEPPGTTLGTDDGKAAEPGGSLHPTPPFRGVGGEPPAAGDAGTAETQGTGNQSGEPGTEGTSRDPGEEG